MRSILSKLFTVLAIITSYAMCLSVGYNYRDMLCGIEHSGFSAPKEIAFLCVIPYAIVIILFLIFARILKKR